MPVGVLGIAALAAAGVLAARASSDSLRPTTPAALLADMHGATGSGLSGTLLAQLSPGLPQLPVGPGAGSSSRDQAPALSGSHTMRFWYGGTDRQRVVLFGATSETDVFHVGRDLWQWDSASRVASHTRLPAASSSVLTVLGPVPSTLMSLSPQQLAVRALAAADSSTVLTVAPGRQVADRATYELVLTPHGSATRVGSVHIEVDGVHKVPLGVQVYARGQSSAAVDVVFTSVTFKTPSADYFAFSPPPGATVHRGAPPLVAASSSAVAPAGSSGHGWTAIVEYRTSPTSRAPLPPAMRAVSGSWGTGQLLESPLLCALITQDGRVFAGAVDPSALYAAAAAHK